MAATLARGRGLSPEWCDLGYRRTTLFILSGITHASQWLLFAANETSGRGPGQPDPGLPASLAAGRRAGRRPEEGWYLRGPSHQCPAHHGVRLALRRPGEFLSFRLRRRGDRREVRELGWQPVLVAAV